MIEERVDSETVEVENDKEENNHVDGCLKTFIIQSTIQSMFIQMGLGQMKLETRGAYL